MGRYGGRLLVHFGASSQYSKRGNFDDPTRLPTSARVLSFTGRNF